MAMIACPNCGLPNIIERKTCKRCKTVLREESAILPRGMINAELMEAAATDILSVEQRRAILEKEVARQASIGWRITNRTETNVQLEMNTGPNAIIAIMLLIFGIVPGILYLALYKGTSVMYIEVDEYGRIKRSNPV